MVNCLGQTIALGSRLGLCTAIAVGFFACSVPVCADDQVVKTAATKPGEDDEKPPISDQHPLYKLLEVAYKARKAIGAVDDYSCTFMKRELIQTRVLHSTMALKFREKPFSVYLKFLDKTNEGREVIYVHGQNSNNLMVHEGGVKSFIGTLNLPPNDPNVMSDNRYPVTQIGLKNMINTIIKQWETEGKFGGIKTNFYANPKLETGENCVAYEVIHELNKDSKPFKEFKFHTTRLYIDSDTGIAFGCQQLGYPTKNDKKPPVIEEYFYTKIKTNLKLTDADFDKNNSSYAFK